jgi:hypothetical protein
MSPLLLAPLLDMGKTLLDRFIPDEVVGREAEAEFLRMAMGGELKQVVAQLEINAKEAQHPSIRVSGWVQVAGFGYTMLSRVCVIQCWPTPIQSTQSCYGKS